MELVYYTDKIKGVSHYNLTVPDGDLAKMKLHDFDRLLLVECEKSKKVSDKLLALETIVRRIEESE